MKDYETVLNGMKTEMNDKIKEQDKSLKHEIQA